MSVITRRCVTAGNAILWAQDDHGKEVLRRLWGDRCLTALQILDLDMPAEDRLRLVLRKQLMPIQIVAELACDFVEHALPAWEQWAAREDREHLTAPRWGVAISRERIKGGVTAESDLIDGKNPNAKNESSVPVEEMRQAFESVKSACRAVEATAPPSLTPSPADAAYLAATAVLFLFDGDLAEARWRATCATSEYEIAKHGSIDAGHEAEGKWQVARVREVLQGGINE